MKLGYILSAALFFPSLALAQTLVAPSENPAYKITGGVQTDTVLMNSQRADGFYFENSAYVDMEWIKSNDLFDGYLYVKLINDAVAGNTGFSDAYATLASPLGLGITAGMNMFDYTGLESNKGIKIFYSYKLAERSEVQVGLFTANSAGNVLNDNRPVGVGVHYLIDNTKFLLGYGMENKVSGNSSTTFQKQAWSQYKVGVKQDTLDKKLVGEAYVSYVKYAAAQTVTQDAKKINVFKDGDTVKDTEQSMIDVSLWVDGYSSYFGISSLLRNDDTLTYHAMAKYVTAARKAQDPAVTTAKLIDYKPSVTMLEIGGGWRVGGFFTKLNFGMDIASDYLAPGELGLTNYLNGADQTVKNIEDATKMPYGGVASTPAAAVALDDGKSKTATKVTFAIGYDF